MSKFLLLGRSATLAKLIRDGLKSNIITNQKTSQLLTISSVDRAKRGTDREGSKKGFSKRAGDTVSGMDSASGHSKSTARQTRSMSQRGASSTGPERGGDSSMRMSKKAGGKLGSHRALSSVKHEKESHQFTLDLGGNEIARIDYKPLGKNMIELYHTEVPERLRGRGIGKTLAKGALECASRSNLKLKVTCDYLDDYVKRFADEKYRKLITK